RMFKIEQASKEFQLGLSRLYEKSSQPQFFERSAHGAEAYTKETTRRLPKTQQGATRHNKTHNNTQHNAAFLKNSRGGPGFEQRDQAGHQRLRTQAADICPPSRRVL